jgi:uroporphyrinogen-III decarboxylase
MQGPGREGLSVGMLIPRSKSAYQLLVEHLAGTEELIYALMDFPEVVEELWARMVQADLEAVRLAVGSGAYGYYLTWEDSSTQNYSPSQYDRYIGSEIGQWCRILEDAGAHYIQHACGHLRDLVVRMREHGAFGVESLSPPPTGNLSLREARARVGQGFGIIGGIEPTSFLNLSHEELAAYTEQVIEDGSGGPFVLANSDSCPPGVTEAKFRLVAEIARHAQVQ